MKLYLISTYDAYMAAEQGFTAMREIPNESRYYKHEVKAEAEVELPQGYTIEETEGGGSEIFKGNEAAELVTAKRGGKYVTSLVTSEGITALHIWNF